MSDPKKFTFRFRVAKRRRDRNIESVLREVFSLVAQIGRDSGREAWRAEIREVPRLLRWVLPWALKAGTAASANPVQWLIRAAQKAPHGVAIRSFAFGVRRWLSFRELVAEMSSCAAQLSHQGVTAGSHVALVVRTDPELVIALGACWWLGAVPCLMDADTPSAELSRQLGELEPHFLWELVDSSADLRLPAGTLRLNLERPNDVNRTDGKPPSPARESVPTVTRTCAKDCGLILATSGTEGRAKLCKVTFGRLVLSGHAFGGLLLKLTPRSVLYCPLPLTHATALLAGLMPAWVHGCTLHLPGAFSASRFKNDVADAEATHVLYVGDLLRYAAVRTHHSNDPFPRPVRFVGNGLDRATWESVLAWFPRATYLEFYGTTELAMLMVNLTPRPGAMGRVPFRAWSRYRVVDWQVPETSGAPPLGVAARVTVPSLARLCGPLETGELLIAMPEAALPITGKFEGYLDPTQEHRAIVRDVFVSGDRYYRTFDRVYFDPDDHFYFVERVGEIWRHSGHNVSTRYVAEQLCTCPCIEDCIVTPVPIDESPYRAGLARVTLREPFDPEQVMCTIASLPKYAQPTFVQVVSHLERTRSYKVVRSAKSGAIFPGRDVEGLYVRIGPTLEPWRTAGETWRHSTGA